MLQKENQVLLLAHSIDWKQTDTEPYQISKILTFQKQPRACPKKCPQTLKPTPVGRRLPKLHSLSKTYVRCGLKAWCTR